ncbi:hypothetical protein J6590_036471 [Homalodisca vitripennis]|nr:hypothetical protein J6590_036471 [Homalodisca vitripennis]
MWNNQAAELLLMQEQRSTLLQPNTRPPALPPRPACPPSPNDSTPTTCQRGPPPRTRAVPATEPRSPGPLSTARTDSTAAGVALVLAWLLTGSAVPPLNSVPEQAIHLLRHGHPQDVYSLSVQTRPAGPSDRDPSFRSFTFYGVATPIKSDTFTEKLEYLGPRHMARPILVFLLLVAEPQHLTLSWSAVTSEGGLFVNVTLAGRALGHGRPLPVI